MKNIKRFVVLGLVSIMSLAAFVSCGPEDAEKKLEEANPTHSQMEEIKNTMGW